MISSAYGMAPSPGGSGQQSGGAFGMFIPLIVIFGIFYFMMIRPQKKKEQQHQKFLTELKKGDEVLTSSGIYGRIAGIDDKIVTLDVGNQMKIRVLKNTVAGIAANPQG
ncbi:MAG: preprotein translocase subunit YajC [Pseudomonadota bacterium]